MSMVLNDMIDPDNLYLCSAFKLTLKLFHLDCFSSYVRDN